MFLYTKVAALLLGVTPAAGLIVALHNQSIERAKRDREGAPSEEVSHLHIMPSTIPRLVHSRFRSSYIAQLHFPETQTPAIYQI